MLVQLGGVSNAVDDKSYTEIVIGCGVDCEKAQLIINALTGEPPAESAFVGISPANILCIFGHSWAQTTALETNHRFWTNPTRCRRVTYRVDYCTRSGCNRMDLTQLTVIALVCC
jgi:hypothetical protein